MKQALIIIAPIVTILIAIIGYASNFVCEKYSWEQKVHSMKTASKDFEYKVDKTVPFYVVVECKGTVGDRYVHERWTGIQFFGGYLWANHENKVKQ